MRRRTLVLGAAAIVALLASAWAVSTELPRWSTPTVGYRDVPDREGCFEITHVRPRQLYRNDGVISSLFGDEEWRVLRTVPLYWSEVIVVDYPEARVIEHGLIDELTLGDIVCTVPGSQAWYYAPTGGVMDYSCSKIDWPDCPSLENLPGPPERES